MEKFASQLLAELTTDLQKIAVGAENRLQQAERSFNAAEQAISKLREFISSYSFKSPEEEIKFFKEIKPEFQKELIFNEEVLSLELHCPVGSNKARKFFIERALNRIQAYFEKHIYIYNYCRSGDTSFDTLYFIRSPKPIPLVPVSYSDIDPGFSNPHSYKVAKLKALEDLRNYIKSILVPSAVNDEVQEVGNLQAKRKMVFTGPKAALEEVIHAMNAKGWFNFGEYATQQVFHDFEAFLNIKLSDPSRSLIGMSIRKNGYTPHIDKMKVALVDKIEQKHQ